MRKVVLGVLLLAGFLQAAPAQYAGWQHSGSLYILTTPEGADLPASASEEGFPLLVQLDKGWFDFSQAKPDGGDIRFAAATGEPLAYQIDQWDPSAGKAAIWVRIPTIKGNTHQEVKVFWGKADAADESKGSAAFNESNGYLSVFHMNDTANDEVGTLECKDTGTTSSSGTIGKGRHFDRSNEIDCGNDITTYPTGDGPHSSELWIRPDCNGGGLLAWGVSKPNSIVQMGLGRPPQIRMDCFYSLAGIRSDSMLAMSQWTHVIHTYRPGDSRIYVNGRLDGFRAGKNVSLAIKSPAVMRIGGKGFIGDMDEVRISKVARSADWIRLQYENQKPMQTAVGLLVQPGTDLSVSQKEITLLEGASVTVTAKAGGAQKVYWVVKRGKQETIAAADRFDFTLDAGRVAGDETLSLRFKAVFADGAKTIDIPVTIKEDIPEPAFTLKAPPKWDGREAIEVVSQVANLSAMRAKGAGELKVAWATAGIAAIKQAAPGKLLLKRAQNSGQLTVTATVSNGGAPTTQTIQIPVKEPAKDAWVQRTPDKDEKPVDGQFYARDDMNEGTLYYNGTLEAPAESVFLKLYADGKLVKTETQKPKADKSYSLSARLKAGLIKYKVEFGTKTGGVEKVLHSADNLVCGDAYIVQGQSNAVAYNYHNVKDRPDFFDANSDWIRSYGTHGESGPDGYANGGWGNAVVTNLKINGRGGVRFVGCWGMTMARKLVEDQKMPICILQGAVGGTRIDQHMPNEADHADTRTIYGRLLKRVIEARLTHGIRGVLWHQGESDQGFDGPDNCYGYETYQRYFEDLTSAWKQDYPNIRHYYVYQIWPNACGMGGRVASDRLRDLERRLSRFYSSLTVMSTLALPSGQGCHFDLADYEKMGLSMVPAMERDNYGRIFDKPITSPDIKKAYYTSGKKDEIALEFDQPMAWDDALASQFCLDGKAGQVVSGAATGNVVKLKLAAPAGDARTITYLVDKTWDHKAILYGQTGLAALTFCEVPISAAKPAP